MCKIAITRIFTYHGNTCEMSSSLRVVLVQEVIFGCNRMEEILELRACLYAVAMGTSDLAMSHHQ
jgi:hypothetical protein